MVTLADRIPGDTTRHVDPPSIEYIRDLRTDSSQYFSGFHTQCGLEDSYYYGTRTIPVPSLFQVDPVRPASGKAIIEIAADHVDVKNISIDVPVSLKSSARGERLKRFYQGAWDSVKEPVLRTAVKQAFGYGVAFLKTGLKTELWYDSPKMSDYGDIDSDGRFILIHEAEWKEALKMFMEKRKMLFPFYIKNVSPKELMWDDSPEGPNWVIRHVQVPMGNLSPQYRDQIINRESKDIVSWTEYWDDTWYCYLIDDQVVKEATRHGYGALPWIPILPAMSMSWDSGTPDSRYQGILHPVHSLLDAEARLITQYNSIVRRHAWPTLDFKGPIRAADDARQRYEQFSGKNVLPENVSVQPSPIPTVPAEIIQNLSMVQTMIEEATFPNVVRGLRPKGVGTGFAISALAGMGRLRFQGVADAMARSIEGVNSNLAAMVESLNMTVTVHARSEVHNFDQTIKPNDIKGYRESRVALKAEAPEEREREALLARQLYQSARPMISLYEAQRRIGISNPIEEQVRMGAEEAVRNLQAEELEQLRQRLAGQQVGQIAEGAGIPPGLVTPGQAPPGAPPGEPAEGNRFLAGLPQLQRLAEGNIQRARIASAQDEPSVFPRGIGGIDRMGNRLGSAPGGRQGTPGGMSVG